MNALKPLNNSDWSKLKLLILDVDGVLTDGQLYFSDQGQELKAFHVQDGLGIRLLLKNGVEVAVITSRNSAVVQQRMESLGVTRIYQGAHAKFPVYQRLIAELGLSPQEVAYMGDDWPDLPVLMSVGVPIAVANAVDEVQQRARYQTRHSGGFGAVREVAECILKANGCYAAALDSYLAGQL